MLTKPYLAIVFIFLCMGIPLEASWEDSLTVSKSSEHSSRKPPQGPKGDRGEAGPPGKQGDPGPEYNVYGSYYTLESKKIKHNEKIKFENSHFKANGIEHHDGSFTVTESGIYEISYGVSQSSDSSSIALQVDDKEVMGSRVYLSKSNDLKFTNLILAITAGQHLSLVNATPDGFIFTSKGTVFENYFTLSANNDPLAVKAIMTIRKIHQLEGTR